MSRKTKTIVLALLSALYIAGLVCFFFNFALGLTLWGAALLPSLILYLYQKHREQLALEEKLAEENNAEQQS